MVVTKLFEDNGLNPIKVSLGEIVLEEKEVGDDKLNTIDTQLTELGFERIDDKKAKIIDKIKSIIINHIHHTDMFDVKTNWSYLLSNELGLEYSYLSSLFSSVEGVTIEHYIINQKIERVKELIFYDELNMNEIADRLGYSSVQHLSAQFKKVTGATPSEFKKSHDKHSSRRSLDSV